MRTNSLELPNKDDVDALSYASLNFDQTSNLYYKSGNSNSQHSTKRRLKAVITQEADGISINGSLFDSYLFQSMNSSFIHDYSNTPKDFNRFIEGHHEKSKTSHLNPHLFKMSFILTLSEWHVDREILLDSCPHNDEKKNECLEEISYYKKFCFPELNSKAKNGGNLVEDSATYVFTRTTSDGEVEYGYCRRIISNNQITKFPIVICIVSTYSYFKLYDAILTELASVYIKNELECSLLMQSFYSKPIPIPTLTLDSSGIICKLNNRRLFFYVCPTDNRLNHDYFSTLVSTLSSNSIVYLFESMLRSKKILCFSNSLSKLTKCCLALSFLLYPFMWTYPFVSIMPSSWLYDLIDSPCPYIYGCLSDMIEQIPSIMEKESVRVNLDTDTIDCGSSDGFIIPLDLRQTLIASLEYLKRFRLIKSDMNLINIACSEACLRVFVELFYRLPDFFKRDEKTLKLKEHSQRFSIALTDLKKIDYRNDENRFGYEFRSDEFLILQPTAAYVTFLNDFIHGMIFLKFLDDYQRPEKPFTLFTQRINERRRMTFDEAAINPVVRFRQTFDLLEKQMKNSSKSATTTTPIFSKLMQKLF